MSDKESPGGKFGDLSPEARPPGSEVLMAEVSLARSAQESPDLIECLRHEEEYCPRCDGSGCRPVKLCAGCGEAVGSVSRGTASR